MLPQNIKGAVVGITNPLSLEEVNDIFYQIILKKEPVQSEGDIKTDECLIQNR